MSLTPQETERAAYLRSCLAAADAAELAATSAEEREEASEERMMVGRMIADFESAGDITFTRSEVADGQAGSIVARAREERSAAVYADRMPLYEAANAIETLDHARACTSGVQLLLGMPAAERAKVEFLGEGEQKHASADYRGRSRYWAYRARGLSEPLLRLLLRYAECQIEAAYV